MTRNEDKEAYPQHSREYTSRATREYKNSSPPELGGEDFLALQAMSRCYIGLFNRLHCINYLFARLFLVKVLTVTVIGLTDRTEIDISGNPVAHEKSRRKTRHME